MNQIEDPSFQRSSQSAQENSLESNEMKRRWGERIKEVLRWACYQNSGLKHWCHTVILNTSWWVLTSLLQIQARGQVPRLSLQNDIGTGSVSPLRLSTLHNHLPRHHVLCPQHDHLILVPEGSKCKETGLLVSKKCIRKVLDNSQKGTFWHDCSSISRSGGR